MRAPAHIRQLDGSAWAGSGCMGAVGAMALDAFTDGVARPTMHQIRAAQDDQVGGIGLGDVRQAWSRGWGLTFDTSPRSWAAVASRLRSHQGVAVTVLYAALRTWRAPGSSYAFGHGLYLSGLNAAGFITVYDPLRSGPVQIPESVVRFAWIGGSGYGTGSNVPRGTNAIGGPDDRPSTSLAAWAGLVSYPIGHVLTTADVSAMVDKLDAAGWLGEGSAKARARFEIAAVLGRYVGKPWTKATQDAIQAELRASAVAAAANPLAAVAGALANLPDTLARTGLLLGLVGLLIAGVVLTFREQSVVAIPSPLRGSARA